MCNEDGILNALHKLLHWINKVFTWTLFTALFLGCCFLMISARAQDLDDVSRLKDYSRPMLCKKIVNGVIMSNETFIVTWAELERIKDNKLWFFHNSRIIKIGKGDSYMCTLVGK